MIGFRPEDWDAGAGTSCALCMPLLACYITMRNSEVLDVMNSSRN